MAGVELRAIARSDLDATLSEMDQREAYELTGMPPNQAIAACVRESYEAWTCEIDGRVAVIGGVTRPGFSGVGYPWIVRTDVAGDVPPVAWVFVLRRLKSIRGAFSRMEGYVRPDNAMGKRWISMLGFTLEEPQRAGVFGIPYHRFWMDL